MQSIEPVQSYLNTAEKDMNSSIERDEEQKVNYSPVDKIKANYLKTDDSGEFERESKSHSKVESIDFAPFNSPADQIDVQELPDPILHD